MTSTERRDSGGDDAQGDDGDSMTLFEHLAELRVRLFRALGAIAVGLAVGFAVYRPVLDFLIQPYCDLPEEIRFSTRIDEGCQLVVMDVLGQFFLVLKVAAVVAVILVGPYVVFQIWRFITPGLRPVERRYAIPFLVISHVLFAAGAAFSYYLLPVALQVLLRFAGDSVVSLLGANEYLGFMLQMMIGAGVAFEFPLVLISLILMGVVGTEGLKKYRRMALFLCFVASAIITPTTDPMTMSIFAIPLIAFYELSYGVAWWVERRRNRKP